MKQIQQVYEKQYKVLLLIPCILILLSLVQIGVQIHQTGDFVSKGIGLSGGSTITISQLPETVSGTNIEAQLREQFPLSELSVRSVSGAGQGRQGIAIDSSLQDSQDIESLAAQVSSLTGIARDQLSIEVTGSSLGTSFFTQTLYSLLAAFVLMGIVVFFYFRSVVPASAVILAAVSDIIVTLAIFNLTGFKLSTAGVAAFLMLIGYSVDTDILLCTKMVKQTDKKVMQRVYDAMRTGLTMTCTTIVAVFVAFLFVKSEVVRQIMLIVLIGLLVDLIMTWIQNVGILRWYLEKKEKQ